MVKPARKRVVIMGAAGRDFHNFNIFYRDNPEYEVVAFTATQIPYITGRKYPPELAGRLYPGGIPIYPEERLPELVRKHRIDQVVFSYSDITSSYVMHKAAWVNSLGPTFILPGSEATMIKSGKPVIAVCAVRTGCGKSQTSRRLVDIIKKMGIKAVAVRHPMPYGDLKKQAVQRFASYEDCIKHDCTIEEREEYEPYTERGMVVYAGVDYGAILKQAEKEADVIIWDGGNNDTPFYRPDLHIVVADAHRPGHEIGYYPGETNARMADILIINKVNTAKPEDVREIEENIRDINPGARIIKAGSAITVEGRELVKGKDVVVVEDGPTVTHGGMPYGAGYIAAKRLGCRIIDPRKYAVGSIKETFTKYPHLKEVLPAMGYSRKQLEELETTIGKTPCDAVLVGTPIDLARLLKIKKTAVRVKYELDSGAAAELERVLTGFLKC
jgi:predicted GTPase